MTTVETVTVSENYQVQIPESMRNSLGIKPGSQYHVVEAFGRIELIPVGNTAALRGFASGIDTSVDPDD